MKVYKSTIRNYTFSVRVKGERKRVEFRDVRDPYFYGVFRTNDKDIQKAIEAHPSFGRIITILSEEKEEVKEEVHEYAAVYPDVKRTQDANRILSGEYGVEKEKLTCKADALKAAKELNISFPNL